MHSLLQLQDMRSSSFCDAGGDVEVEDVGCKGYPTIFVLGGSSSSLLLASSAITKKSYKH